MAKNAFQKFQGYVDKPKRNVFDLSYQNNLTLGFGSLVPVFCKEVIPGDSFRIKPTFGFRMMPLVFPIQTKISANLHFFYVRNRNLWKDWPDFIGKTKAGLTPPYLAPETTEQINALYKTGSLGDYLGLPTTHVGAYGFDATMKAQRYSANSNTGYYAIPYDSLTDLLTQNRDFGDVDTGWTFRSVIGIGTSSTSGVPRLMGFAVDAASEGQSADIRVLRVFHFNTGSTIANPVDGYLVFNIFFKDGRTAPAVFKGSIYADSSVEGYNAAFALSEVEAFESLVKWYVETKQSPTSALQTHRFYIMQNQTTTGQTDNPVKVTHDSDVLASGFTTDAIDITSINRLPYHVSGQTSDQSSKVRVSALPFRAYESIYNAFYRNQQNDPFMINGEPEYNKFIENQEGGADTFSYALRQRNWEKDYLTTCVKSPQQGIAPLVGVSASGTFTFENEEGTQYTAKAVIGEDGHTLTGIETMSPELNANGTGRMLVDMISHGISINDFRNVNALQRWLETNIRRGFRYKDQILSHYGVDPDFAAMDMPEFIGGISRPVQVNTVTQTSEGSSDPLGSYAANATCFGEGQDITKYCDEHGFIIGILSVVPTPNYSQLLPKLFLKSDPLDYFFPEFGHIGMQPILYNEVCPVQAFYRQDQPDVSEDILHKTFGYQRAWYDYLGSVDEVHGLMRTDLRNFVMNRTFNELPELGARFLHIDEKQLNQVFADTDDSDKIIGLIDFRVSAKRPIPEYGIPRLE